MYVSLPVANGRLHFATLKCGADFDAIHLHYFTSSSKRYRRSDSSWAPIKSQTGTTGIATYKSAQPLRPKCHTCVGHLSCTLTTDGMIFSIFTTSLFLFDRNLGSGNILCPGGDLSFSVPWDVRFLRQPRDSSNSR